MVIDTAFNFLREFLYGQSLHNMPTSVISTLFLRGLIELRNGGCTITDKGMLALGLKPDPKPDEWRVIALGGMDYEGDTFLGFFDNMETAKKYLQDQNENRPNILYKWLEWPSEEGSPSCDYHTYDYSYYSDTKLIWSKKIT